MKSHRSVKIFQNMMKTKNYLLLMTTRLAISLKIMKLEIRMS